MSAVSDPLRFLNIKKKRQVNKQKVNGSVTTNKQQSVQQASNIVFPSFSSFNSLENELPNKIKKTYNPLKYFNPQVQEYLNKLKLFKIAHSPVMPQLKAHQEMSLKQSSQINNNQNTSQNQKISMMTFAKSPDFSKLKQVNNQTKTLFNFYKPGLKKSGSMKMMQKLQQENNVNAQTINIKNNEINPWELSQGDDQIQKLQQCQICSRKFNIKSYQKHVKVCEKVFFHKRKPFNSRSNSLDKKQAAK